MTKLIYKDLNWETEYDYPCHTSENLATFQIKLKRPVLKSYLNKLNNYISKLLKDPNNPIPIACFDNDKLEIDPIHDQYCGCYDLVIHFKDTNPIEFFATNSSEIKNFAIQMFSEIQKITNNSYIFFIEDLKYENNTGFFIEKEGLFPCITNLDTWIKPSYNKFKQYIDLQDYLFDNKEKVSESIKKTTASLINHRGDQPDDFELKK